MLSWLVCSNTLFHKHRYRCSQLRTGKCSSTVAHVYALNNQPTCFAYTVSAESVPQRPPARGVAGLLHRFSMKHMASIYRKPSSVPAAPEDPEEEILLYVVGVPHLYIFSTYVIKRKQETVGLYWALKYCLFCGIGSLVTCAPYLFNIARLYDFSFNFLKPSRLVTFQQFVRS